MGSFHLPKTPATVPNEKIIISERNILRQEIVDNLKEAIYHLSQSEYLPGNKADLTYLQNLLNFVEQNETRFVEICNVKM